MSFGFQFPADRPKRVPLPVKVPDQGDGFLFVFVFDQASPVQAITEGNVPPDFSPLDRLCARAKRVLSDI